MPIRCTSHKPVAGCSTAVVAVKSQSARTTMRETTATARTSRDKVVASR